mmetsp:Transcript_14865/g.44547  ORF Transcript_14865/g.44547 Transcript_14865/m.44547 type:complete len:252 (-) Transcript_14865:345-1100(-)
MRPERAIHRSFESHVCSAVDRSIDRDAGARLRLESIAAQLAVVVQPVDVLLGRIRVQVQRTFDRDCARSGTDHVTHRVVRGADAQVKARWKVVRIEISVQVHRRGSVARRRHKLVVVDGQLEGAAVRVVGVKIKCAEIGHRRTGVAAGGAEVVAIDVGLHLHVSDRFLKFDRSGRRGKVLVVQYDVGCGLVGRPRNVVVHEAEAVVRLIRERKSRDVGQRGRDADGALAVALLFSHSAGGSVHSRRWARGR